MVSAKSLAQMAKKWQRMAVIGRKRLTRTTTAPRGAAYDECCTASSVAMEGHCVVYTGDGARFEVPLAYLGTNVFGKLLRMSQEEFGFAGIHDGRITLPCDAAVMDYAMCFVMSLAYIHRVGLVSWARVDGLGPTKLPGATYTFDEATNRPSGWITAELRLSSPSSVFLSSPASGSFRL